MYTIYIDETGTNDDCTILAGVIVHSKNSLQLNNDINNMLLYVFGTNNINLKDLRRKVYQDHVFSEQQYIDFNQRYYALLKNHCPIFIVTGVKNSYNTFRPDKIKKAYKMLLERFYFFLKKKNEFGQVVYDKGDSCYKHIYEEHKGLMKNGSSWGWQYDKINDIYDKDDEECRALQIADLLAYSMWRHYHRNDSRHYNQCLPFFDTGPNGQIDGYGLKILS